MFGTPGEACARLRPPSRDNQQRRKRAPRNSNDDGPGAPGKIPSFYSTRPHKWVGSVSSNER
jgi:hypothetical protein